MDAVRMLVHDHEVLTSQVEHVSALVYGLLGGAFAAEAMREELLSQVESLKDQLLEHFGFEEEAAFPFLAEALPDNADQLRTLSQSHDRIARSLVEVAELVRLTTKENLAPQLGPIAAGFDRFVNAYRSHVGEESEVLSAMEERLSSTQREQLSDIAKKLV